jgi:hypothetical protein
VGRTCSTTLTHAHWCAGVPDPLPQRLRRSVAVYEAGKALLAHITPEFEEIARVGLFVCVRVRVRVRVRVYVRVCALVRGREGAACAHHARI